MIKKYINLLALPINKPGTVYEVNAGHGLKRRLISLGLRKGTLVQKLSNSGGPVLLDLKGLKIAIGRGVANKIIVEYETK